MNLARYQEFVEKLYKKTRDDSEGPGWNQRIYSLVVAAGMEPGRYPWTESPINIIDKISIECANYYRGSDKLLELISG